MSFEANSGHLGAHCECLEAHFGRLEAHWGCLEAHWECLEAEYSIPVPFPFCICRNGYWYAFAELAKKRVTDRF